MQTTDNGSDSDNEPDMFVCDNGNEIPMDWVNDGMDDCGDNSDEYDDDNSDMTTMIMTGIPITSPICSFVIMETRFQWTG